MAFPSRDDCLEMLSKYQVDEFVVLHSLAVADVAVQLARLLREKGETIDLHLTESAALLHDIGKGRLVEKYTGTHASRDHAFLSAQVVCRENVPELATAVGKHMLDSILDPVAQPKSWEERLVWYADKTTQFRHMGLSRRMRDIAARHRQASRTVSLVLPHAESLENDIFSRLGDASPAELKGLVARRTAGRLDTAIGTTFDYSVEIGDMMAAVGEEGFGSVSLAGGNVGHSGYSAAAGLERLRDLRSRTGVGITSIHAPFHHDMASPDAGARHSAVEDTLVAVRAAATLGAGVVIVHPHGWLEIAEEETIRTINSSVRAIVDGSPESVRIAVENLPSPCSPAVLRAVLGAFPSERVGFCYDSSHHNLRPREFDFLGEFGDRLISVHISDNRGERDDHQIPGEGVIDWRKFASRFGRIDYHEPFLLEVETRESSWKDHRAFLPEAFAMAEWLLALSDRLGVLT